MTKPAIERLRAALDFLAARADSMRRVAPKDHEDEYASTLWYPLEPSYSWPTYYGDFTPATLMAGVRRGLIDRPDASRHAYRITEEGRAILEHFAAMALGEGE